ncbi:hypothetical protein ACSVDA_10935 [Cytobacillus sp. Hm23]
MSINQIVINTLESVGVPVEFHHYDGDEKTYITFFEYNQGSGLHADDDEQKTVHYVQVDVWSDLNYMNLVDQVKEKLKNVGFRRTSEADLYERDTGIYHKVMRFSYTT